MCFKASFRLFKMKMSWELAKWPQELLKIRNNLVSKSKIKTKKYKNLKIKWQDASRAGDSNKKILRKLCLIWESFQMRSKILAQQNRWLLKQTPNQTNFIKNRKEKVFTDEKIQISVALICQFPYFQNRHKKQII